DNRDIRVRIDLTIPIGRKARAEALRDAIQPFIQYAKNINEGLDNAEMGHVTVEKCGHSQGLPCEVIARWEVDKGRTI
ncbi:hypothetical protein LCGC14_2426650, partial [marine sediment metagenome]